MLAFKQFLSDILSILISDDQETRYFQRGVAEIGPMVAAFVEIETRLAKVGKVHAKLPFGKNNRENIAKKSIKKCSVKVKKTF